MNRSKLSKAIHVIIQPSEKKNSCIQVSEKSSRLRSMYAPWAASEFSVLRTVAIRSHERPVTAARSTHREFDIRNFKYFF